VEHIKVRLSFHEEKKRFFFSICHQDFIPEKKKREEDRADPAKVEPELASGEIVEFFLKTHRLPKTLHEDPQQSWKQITCWLLTTFENKNKLARFIAKFLKCSSVAVTSIPVIQLLDCKPFFQNSLIFKGKVRAYQSRALFSA
jgi:hypothetical protein